MSNPSEWTFKLLIYESEYREIQAWTLKHQDRETGGDLFGLWADDCTAVVQLVLGPGEHCRRTSTSFYQDLDYLKRMGDVLTSEEGLCHIGEWHSHHTLSLMETSEGDERTIWSNMDRYGLSRFCLFITNILTKWRWQSLSSVPDKTTVNGFLFEVDRRHQRRLPVLHAEFILLQEESPFRLKYIGAIRDGAESLNTVQDHLRVVKKCQQLELELNKVLQAKQELETSLTAELQETNKELRIIKQQFDGLENTLAAERQVREETERRLHSNEQRSSELQTSLAAQTQAREETARRLHVSEQRSHELETILATVQQELEESRRSNEPSCDWILDRNEISLSDTEIGVGAWGRVVEGTFGGSEVAVKEIHQVIMSPHNRRLFEREMNIASKCRHPCLLQFIGATNDDQSPLFVTELLETNLRAVLHERPLEPFELTTIALDVAKGLNYLHLKRPDPIVHRDISSANVLLWKKGANWRAKVSDYGTANFLQTTMTACPGAVIYSAPEAHTSKQSPKVDVYSFGVLLCEMNIREFPDVNKRNQQIARVTNTFHKRLIRRCLLQDSKKRPSMAEIIEEIKPLAQRQSREETERFYSSKQRSHELETSLAAERHAREETERRLHSSEHRSHELETSLAAERQAKEETERRLYSSEQRSRELETSLTEQTQGRKELKAALDEEQKAHEETRRNTFGYWSLTRNEIALSDMIITEEEWGNVIEGSFYDCKVAVKVIHPSILPRARTHRDRSFFEREIKTAIECRHPCLLQFIGATFDDQIGPLFVTELPDTNLRTLLQEHPLEPSNVTTIALDVAKGINYLHQKRPDPIVHGDIRSDNVLLWKKGGAGWQAKISDFCTNNILQQSITNFPLDSIYVAPEAQTFKSVKVDVYSFGVLLWEMNTGELPDKKRKDQQIARLSSDYESIVTRCLREDPEKRPSMAKIIEKIKTLL
ncbi:uncharacterized protein LOC116306870 [Actinia tenebrosa]|uniref:Uncharacterized protein LOC116306870 n=1 Tax=Actinia tenebrosa TaxID=6105 RepID=A0A6P8J4D0_ACTTE|nr:uncharacterized protein LOC116306870 [Actinia tenebrosa]